MCFSYRFPQMYPQAHIVREAQKELDNIIQQGIKNITKLLNNAENEESRSKNMKQKKEGSQAIDCKFTIYKFINKTTFLIVDESTPERHISNQLIARGLLTPKMLKQLQKEWKKEKLNDDESNKND